MATMMRPSAVLEYLFKISLDGLFRNGVARLFGVRAVHHEGVHAHLAELLEFFEALRFAFVVVVDAEVREVDDIADRSLHQHAGRFRDRVRYAEEIRASKLFEIFISSPSLDDCDVHFRRIRKIIRALFDDRFRDRVA